MKREDDQKKEKAAFQVLLMKFFNVANFACGYCIYEAFSR